MKFFGSFLIVIFFSIQLFAANAYLKNETLYEGDIATLVIHLEGKDIRIKRINEVAGLPVIEHGGHSNSKYINGEKIKDIYYEIKFYPQSSMTIPPLEVTTINGEKQRTNPVEIIVKKSPNPAFIFEAFINNDTPFQNETVKYTLRFKYNDTFNFQDIKFIQPDFPGLWLEVINFSPPEKEGNIMIREVNYFLTPKKIGQVIIGQGQFEATQQGSDSSSIETKHKRIFTSQPISLEIKPLATTTNLAGNFEIETVVDKKVVDGNDMVHLIVRIKGEGNFNDIEPFSVDFDNATVSKKDPKVQIYPDNGKIRGIFVQDFFIGNAKGDFTIPSFTLKAYDFKTKSDKTIQSEPIKIHVSNPIIEEVQRGGKEEEITLPTKKGFQLYSLNLIIGFLVGAISILVIQFLMKRKHLVKIINPTNNKTLLQKLLPYKGTENCVDALIQKLEGKLYHNLKITIPHKEIKDVLKYISNKV